MSVRNTLRAMPTLLKIGLFEAVAYRAEMFVWVLSTTMPFISLALWLAVSHEAPVTLRSGHSMGPKAFQAYFLCDFVVRQLGSSWAAWQMNFEVRTGTMSMRLLRPVHPLFAYAAENVAAIPMRLVVAVPVFCGAVWLAGDQLSKDPFIWVAWAVAMVGAWGITFLANVLIGTLSLLMESSIKFMDLYLTLFFIFSGYLYPLDVFPPAVRAVAEVLPFRYQIGLPVELMLGVHAPAEALGMLARQWLVALAMLGLLTYLWRTGVKRFAAYGG